MKRSTNCVWSSPLSLTVTWLRANGSKTNSATCCLSPPISRATPRSTPALRRANAKFERRFRRMEQLALSRGLKLESLSLAEQDALWDAAKREERGG
jgi:hypothetical protein